MPELPTGTLTFLFTDVEGSTPLWEHHEATMRAATARHDALLDAIITAQGGMRVRERGEGDSLFAVFTDAAAAAIAALAMAQALQAEPWPPETPLRVRIALHTGSAELRQGDYYGPVVNRCARIRGLGHGGQLLLSTATAALVRDALPARASLRPLGAHPLRGLSAPEDVYQLCHPDLPGEFPPLHSPAAPRHNLPLAANALIGREAEQSAVLALLAQARLVTLTGSGGVGKTRLALAVAAELVDQYADGVWLVELATLAEERLVSQAVLEALGAREEAGRPLLATLSDYLKARHVLLVVDNCEHLIAACATLAGTLLRTCPQVHILVTSREGLAVAGEQCYRVPSLPVPDLAHLPAPEELTEAAALFVSRARERRPDFGLTATNARAIAEICARLDGIPLALELAAARVDSLGVAGIAARLDDRFRLLTGGARDALPRQQTLRAALDWSYDLLSQPERWLLDRLCVFAGGWMLAAAEAICAGNGVEQWEILDLLASLVHKSLVQATEVEGGVRYGLLETMRQYGQERLAAAGALDAVRDRHLAWYLALAEEAGPHLQAATPVTWLDRLETEHDNLRAALRWAMESKAGEDGLRLAGALGNFWYVHGHRSEGLNWLETTLAARTGGLDAARAKALVEAGALASQQGDFARGAALLEESLTLYRAMGDPHAIARALRELGDAAMRLGDYARATPLYEEALALYQVVGDAVGTGYSLLGLAWLAWYRGDYERASVVCKQGMAQIREAGDSHGLANAMSQLAHVLERQGAYEQAVAVLEEAVALWRDARNPDGTAWVLMNLGWCLLARGEDGRSTALLEEEPRDGPRDGGLLGCSPGARVFGLGGLPAGRARSRNGPPEDGAGVRPAAQRPLGYRLDTGRPGMRGAGAGRVRARGDVPHRESPDERCDWRQGRACRRAGGRGLARRCGGTGGAGGAVGRGG